MLVLGWIVNSNYQFQELPAELKRWLGVYLVFVLINRVTLHAVYRRAPAGSIALCDVLCGEQEKHNLTGWKQGRLETWVYLDA